MNLCFTKWKIAGWHFLLAFFLSAVAISCGGKSPNNSEPKGEWVPSNTGLESLVLQFLTVHPLNSDVIFAGTWDGLYKSINSAQTWYRVDSGWAYAQVVAIAFDALNPDIMYAGTKGDGIFKSEDGGETWEKRSVGLVDPIIYSVTTDPSHSDTLFVGCDGGIARSYDGADTLVTVLNYNRAFLAIDPQNSQIVYAGGKYNNLYKSIDGGESWSKSSEGLILGGPGVRIQWVLINPIQTDVLYVGSLNLGVYKSTDAGASWAQASKGVGSVNVRVVALDFSDPDHLYAATEIGVYESTDAAGTWQEMNQGLTNQDVTALAIDPGDPRILYAGTWGGGVFVWQGK